MPGHYICSDSTSEKSEIKRLAEQLRIQGFPKYIIDYVISRMKNNLENWDSAYELASHLLGLYKVVEGVKDGEEDLEYYALLDMSYYLVDVIARKSFCSPAEYLIEQHRILETSKFLHISLEKLLTMLTIEAFEKSCLQDENIDLDLYRPLNLQQKETMRQIAMRKLLAEGEVSVFLVVREMKKMINSEW